MSTTQSYCTTAKRRTHNLPEHCECAICYATDAGKFHVTVPIIITSIVMLLMVITVIIIVKFKKIKMVAYMSLSLVRCPDIIQ